MRSISVVIVIAVLLAGCATSTRYIETAQPGADLSAFIASAGPFQQRGDDCVVALTFKDGVRTEIAMRAERCVTAVTFLRAEALVRQQQAQQAARAKAAEEPAK